MNNYFPFTEKTRLADLIHQDYKLIPVIGRFGIKFGFGNKTVSEVCRDYNINKWFFLEIINSFHNSNYFPTEELQHFSAQTMVSYLSNTHAWYLNVKVPEIEDSINEMKRLAPNEDIKNIKLISDFFQEYKNELVIHLDEEDSKVFPYIISLEKSLEMGVFDKELIRKIQDESIEEYERNHDNLEVKLADLKNLIIKYLPPVSSYDSCQRLLIELFRLEADIENHTRIEEKVLVPKVKLLEQEIIQISGAGK